MRVTRLVGFLPLAIAVLDGVAYGEEVTKRLENDEPLGFRLGTLAGVSEQPTEIAVGVRYDLMNLARQSKLAVDITFGAKPRGATIEPMIGVRFPLSVSGAPKVRPYLGAFAGYNLSWDNGVGRAAIPFRLATGATYDIRPHFGVGLDLAVEVGPALAPSTGTYAAVQVAAGIAW